VSGFALAMVAPAWEVGRNQGKGLSDERGDDPRRQGQGGQHRRPGATVGEALRCMRAERVGRWSSPRTVRTVSGIISDRDVLYAIADRGAAALDESVAT
jgi:CBS domain-containing protein